jgi:hypothetical protein
MATRRRSARWFATLILAGLALAPASAVAEGWTPERPPSCPAQPDDPTEARRIAGDLFRQATTRGEEGAYIEASALFTCCYLLAPHPSALLNLAIAAEHSGDLDTAQHALEEFLTQAPDSPNRGDAETLLLSVRERLASVQPPIEPPVEPPVEPPIEPPVGPPVEPPPPTLPPANGATDGSEGESAGMSTMAIAGWSTLGAGALVALTAGTAFAALAADEADAIDDAARDTYWRDMAGHQENYDTYVGAGIAMFVIGGAAAAAGAVLLILDATSESPGDAALAPIVTPESVGLALVGRF